MKVACIDQSDMRSMHNKNSIRNLYTSKSIWVAIVIIIIIILIMGILFHELYRLTNNNRLVGYFMPINESVWEHLKLILTPFILVGLVLSLLIGNNSNNFIFALTSAIVIGCIIIIMIFYSYTGVTGSDSIIADITLFILAFLAGMWIFYQLINYEQLPKWVNIISTIIIFTLVILFMIWTYNPPHIPLFISPV